MNNNINFKLLLLFAIFYNIGIKSAMEKEVNEELLKNFHAAGAKAEYKSFLDILLANNYFLYAAGTGVAMVLNIIGGRYISDFMNARRVRGNLKIIFPDNNIIDFSDIIGCQEIKNILSLTIKRLKKNKKGKGVLLYGPPGNGKTHFVLGLAKEARMPIISINSSNLITEDEYFLSNIELVFKTVEQLSPCIFFIDELDLLIKNRDRIHLSDKQETMLSIFLQKFDGLNSNSKKGVLVVGCTNHIDNIDPAMLRHGRLGKKILIDLPIEKDIQELFEKKCKNYESFRRLFLKQDIYQKMHKHKMPVVSVVKYIDTLNDELDEKNKQESRQIDNDDNEELLESIVIDINKMFGVE
jgi:SpoVK/Ycf46/Vps4 family AAA+-type ATPase